MNGIIWIFTIWFHCDKLVLKPANQVCNGTQIRCALGHSTAIENTSDPKKAVTLLCSPPALSQWPVQFELSVLFIRCSHNCHLHCDECYTLDLTSCVSWGFLCFWSMVDLEFISSGNFSFVVKQGKKQWFSLYLK